MSERHVDIPGNITFNIKEFSLKAKKWLQITCNLTVEQIRKHRIGYIPTTNKIFIPAIKEDVIQFYQLRALNEGDIKYVTYGRSSAHLIHYRSNNTKSVVVTEDNISAMRVAQHENVIALSGTTLHKQEIPKLLDMYDTFIFWLDADEPGQKATTKNVKLLQEHISKQNVRQMFVGDDAPQKLIYRVDNTRYVDDPKCYLNTEIIQILEETLHGAL